MNGQGVVSNNNGLGGSRNANPLGYVGMTGAPAGVQHGTFNHFAVGSKGMGTFAAPAQMNASYVKY